MTNGNKSKIWQEEDQLPGWNRTLFLIRITARGKKLEKIFTTFSCLVCFRSPQKSRLHLLLLLKSRLHLLLKYRLPPRSSANTTSSFAGYLPVARVPPTFQGKSLTSSRFRYRQKKHNGRGIGTKRGNKKRRKYSRPFLVRSLSAPLKSRLLHHSPDFHLLPTQHLHPPSPCPCQGCHQLSKFLTSWGWDKE